MEIPLKVLAKSFPLLFKSEANCLHSHSGGCPPPLSFQISQSVLQLNSKMEANKPLIIGWWFPNRLPVKKTNHPNAVNRLKVNVDGEWGFNMRKLKWFYKPCPWVSYENRSSFIIFHMVLSNVTHARYQQAFWKCSCQLLCISGKIIYIKLVPLI